MKQVTHYKTFDRDRWRPVRVPHPLDLNRVPVSVITGKKYVYVAGITARELKFADGSEYHVDRGWS